MCDGSDICDPFPTPTAVYASFVASGDVSDYDAAKQSTIASVVASAVGVAASDVAITVQAASVRITVQVHFPSSPAASAAVETLSTGIFHDPAALEAALAAGGVSGVSVAAIMSSPATHIDPHHASPPPPPNLPAAPAVASPLGAPPSALSSDDPGSSGQGSSGLNAFGTAVIVIFVVILLACLAAAALFQTKTREVAVTSNAVSSTSSAITAVSADSAAVDVPETLSVEDGMSGRSKRTSKESMGMSSTYVKKSRSTKNLALQAAAQSQIVELTSHVATLESENEALRSRMATLISSMASSTSGEIPAEDPKVAI